MLKRQKYKKYLVSNNKISIETVQQKTIDKWGISFDKNLNKYVSKT